MTQQELAEKLGYRDKSSIAKIEAGVNSLTMPMVERFADALDEHGTDMVDTVLDKEYDRCCAEDGFVPFLNAAHERTDIDPTDEMRQHDEAIMDDPDF